MALNFKQVVTHVHSSTELNWSTVIRFQQHHAFLILSDKEYKGYRSCKTTEGTNVHMICQASWPSLKYNGKAPEILKEVKAVQLLHHLTSACSRYRALQRLDMPLQVSSSPAVTGDPLLCKAQDRLAKCCHAKVMQY